MTNHSGKNSAKPAKPAKSIPLPWLVALLVIVSAGIIAVAWFSIESLQDNSNKLRKYKVLPSANITPSTGLELKIGEFATRDDKDVAAHAGSIELLNRYEVLQREHRYREGITVLEKALLVFGKELGSRKANNRERSYLAAFHRRLSAAYYNLRDYPSAINQINISIELQPKSGLYLQDRADLYRIIGKVDAAKQDLAQANKLGIPVLFNEAEGPLAQP